MTATASSATSHGAGRAGVSGRPRRAAGAAVLALIIVAATPACAKDETIFSNFLNALAPNATPANPEPPEAETKAAPRKPDPRPLAIQPRSAKKIAVAPPPAPSAVRETLPADATITTGATGPITPAQAQTQPQGQQSRPQQQAPQQMRPQSQQQALQTSQSPAAAAPAAAARPVGKQRAEAKSAAQQKPAPAASPPSDSDGEAAQFCRNITDAASDARFGWQVRVLEDLDKQVKESTTRLEAKRAEYEDWLKRREDFLRKVEDGVVEMYGRMRPDAAALQIASMSEEVALSVLMKLKPRASSAILGEMEPTRAARLTDSLAGVRLTTQQGKTP